MTAPPSKPEEGDADIQPSRRQFIDQRFHENLAGLPEAKREQLVRLVHQRLFFENASVAAVRHEIQRVRRNTRVVAITSGKGGVGKTTLSVNLAIAVAQSGKRVLLFDADLGMANTHVFAGVNPTATLADALAGRIALQTAIIPGPAGTDVICGVSGVGWLADLRPSQIESLGRELLAVAADYDVLILDTGAGIASTVMHFLALAHDIVVVASPNLAATLDAYGIIKTTRESHIAGRLHIVINQSENEGEAARAAERIATCSDRFLHHTPEYLGWLRRDRAVEKANQDRNPLMLSNSGNVNARRIARFAASLLSDTSKLHECAAA